MAGFGRLVQITMTKPTNHDIWFYSGFDAAIGLKPEGETKLLDFEVRRYDLRPGRREDTHFEVVDNHLEWHSWSNDQDADFWVDYHFFVWSFQKDCYIKISGRRSHDDSKDSLVRVRIKDVADIERGPVYDGLPVTFVWPAEGAPFMKHQ